ncbi:MAG: hypothetical protein ACOC1K_02965 [Nanoarchaeota archaeon]
MNDFGGSSIDKSLFYWIKENLEEGKTILEFGSGSGSTKNLSKFYNMISIEHDSKWVGKYQSFYIWATINKKENWYDIEPIKKLLKNKDYDLILVDGPVGEGNRWGFLKNIELFDIKNKHIIIDDINRNGELNLFNSINSLLERKVYKKDKWGVLLS